MQKTVKITTTLKELTRVQAEYENKRQNISKILFNVCKNAPVSEKHIFNKLGVAQSTWSSYKKKGLPYDKIFELVEILKGFVIDNKPIIN